MSLELEEIYNAFINNKVPNSWSKASYPSLRPLGSWVNDLVLRIAFIKKVWISLLALINSALPSRMSNTLIQCPDLITLNCISG